MALVASPYGLRPVSMLSSQYMSHGIRMIRIAPAFATNLFNGDVVCLDAAGFLSLPASGTDMTTSVANTPVGVFTGCEYESATQGLRHANMWTGGTVTVTGRPIWGYVVDDPTALFEIQAAGPIDIAAIGMNISLILTAGNVATGRSRMSAGLTAAVAATPALPLRIIDAVERPGSTINDAFTDIIVRFNNHRHTNTTGF